MPKPEHLAKLKEGVEAWNEWRSQNPNLQPDLREANLLGANLAGASLDLAYLIGANLTEANLTGVILARANLNGANLTRAYLIGARLYRADLTGVNLTGANLTGADLTSANLTGANLTEARLSRAVLVETNLEGATLTACTVYGVSVWNVRLERAIQSNLVITSPDESIIQVDNLEVAQFVYLLLNNQRLRHVIDTITSKVVLILGRFTPERKVVLDAIREELRKRDYLPVIISWRETFHRYVNEQFRSASEIATTTTRSCGWFTNHGVCLHTRDQ